MKTQSDITGQVDVQPPEDRRALERALAEAHGYPAAIDVPLGNVIHLPVYDFDLGGYRLNSNFLRAETDLRLDDMRREPPPCAVWRFPKPLGEARNIRLTSLMLALSDGPDVNLLKMPSSRARAEAG